jgi:tRNA(fMet)-specific endonuclease VapC
VNGRVALDTDVLSYLFKKDSRSSLFTPHMRNRQPILSVMTVGEVRRWAIERRWGRERISSLEAALAGYAIAPLTERTARIWADVFVSRSRAGRPITVSDCWVAASALEYELPLITNNQRHFEGIEGLKVLGPIKT